MGTLCEIPVRDFRFPVLSFQIYRIYGSGPQFSCSVCLSAGAYFCQAALCSLQTPAEVLTIADCGLSHIWKF